MPLYLVTCVCDEGVWESSFKVFEAECRLDIAREIYRNPEPWKHWLEVSKVWRPSYEEQDCPPPSATTDALRAVMLGWLDETTVPPHAVLCTPSKNIETWVLVSLFSGNEQAKKANVECRWSLEVQLRQHGLMKGAKKLIDKYKANEKGIQEGWPSVREKCSEAERFSADFLALIPAN